MYSYKTKTACSLRACRGCLATEVRLIDMRQNRLMEAYSRLIQVADDLPHYMCSYCAALLLKCDTFRIKCVDALLTLRNVQLDNGQITMERVKMSRQTNKFILPYNQSQTQILNIDEMNEENNIKFYDPKINSAVFLNEIEYNFNNDIKEEVVDEVEIDTLDIKPFHTNIDELLQDVIDDTPSKDIEDEESSVSNKDGIKPILIISNGLYTDHDYALNNNANKLISNVIQEYLQGIVSSEVLKSFEVNLYCNKSTLMKINENKNMKLKIVDEVDSTEMNAKLRNLLNGKNGDYMGTDIIETLKKQLNVKTDSEACVPNISNDGKFITIDFNDASKADVDAENASDMDSDGQTDTYTPFNLRSLNHIPKVDNELLALECNMDILYYNTKKEQMSLIQDRKKTNNYIYGELKCEFCCKGFVGQDKFDKHMLRHNEVCITNIKAIVCLAMCKFVCDICNLRFKKRYQLNMHKTHHAFRFTCKECTFSTSYTTVAKDHHMWHSGSKYSCKHCGKEFSGRSSYYAHLKVAHPTSDKLIRCEMCGDSFCGAIGIRQHERMAHHEMTSPKFRCSRCKTQFYCSDAFNAHQGSDGLCDPRMNFCVRCGMSFETEELLEEHEIEQRKPRDDFECEVCKKKFSNYLYYNAHRMCHQKDAHRGHYEAMRRQRRRAPSMCELCGAIVKNPGLLKLHHRIRHSNEKPYQCTFCPKKFKSSTTLKIHSRTHTGESPYKCRSCPKAFPGRASLTQHERRHTGERPHKCPTCSKTFATTTSVKTHIKTVHMNMPVPPRIRHREKKTV